MVYVLWVWGWVGVLEKFGSTMKQLLKLLSRANIFANTTPRNSKYLCLTKGHSNVIVCLKAPARIRKYVHVIFLLLFFFFFFFSFSSFFYNLFFPFCWIAVISLFFCQKQHETIVSQQEYEHGHKY